MSYELQQPHSVCANCFAVWKANPQREHYFYCHHFQTLARLEPNGLEWHVLTDVSAREVEEALRRLARERVSA